ncbi:hypothetical protein [Muriicola sp.]|uniref:hypothetical protein n=1 Tax=Muriicola sp. TaxID=2020856 RepID=UPI003C721F41
MVSSYSVIKKNKHLVMTMRGAYDYREFLELPNLILQECEDHQCYKILVDLNLVVAKDIALIELFFLGEKIAEVLGKTVMIALVWKSESLSDFLVDVATNRSARLKVFATNQRAHYWLLNEY